MIAIDQQASDPRWLASENEWRKMCWAAMAAHSWPLARIDVMLILPKLHLATLWVRVFPGGIWNWSVLGKKGLLPFSALWATNKQWILGLQFLWPSPTILHGGAWQERSGTQVTMIQKAWHRMLSLINTTDLHWSRNWGYLRPRTNHNLPHVHLQHYFYSSSIWGPCYHVHSVYTGMF